MIVKKKRILVSVSGGRTSGLMAWLLWNKYKNDPTVEIIFVFANTSREDNKTLMFVKEMQMYWGIPIVWIESKVWHNVRKSCTFTIVDYNKAKRDGSVFEEVIKKYGIPSKWAPHCTRELKTRPILAYAKSLGWGPPSEYITCIGLRVDELKRSHKDYKSMDLKDLEYNEDGSLWYPLIGWNVNKQDVAAFWKRQEFDLDLEDYNGNCKLCFKKSDTKIVTQQLEKPDTWIPYIEAKYGNFIGSKNPNKVKPPFRFFRHARTLEEVMELSKMPGFRKAEDQSMYTDGFEKIYIDDQDSCGNEECRPF